MDTGVASVIAAEAHSALNIMASRKLHIFFIDFLQKHETAYCYLLFYIIPGDPDGVTPMTITIFLLIMVDKLPGLGVNIVHGT